MSNPNIPEEDKMSSLPGNEDVNTNDEVGENEMSTPVSTDVGAAISSMQTEEAEEITGEVGGNEMITPVSTDVGGAISSTPTEEAEEITGERGVRIVSPQGSISSDKKELTDVIEDEKPLEEVVPLSTEEKSERILGSQRSTSSIKNTEQEVNDREQPLEEVVSVSTEDRRERISSPRSPSSSKNVSEDVNEGKKQLHKRRKGTVSSRASLASNKNTMEDVDDSEKQLGVEIKISMEDERERIQSSQGSVSSFKNTLENVDEGYEIELCEEMEIMDENIEYKARKPFIGGYILYPSKVELHNATTNTSFLPQSQLMQERKLERSTQTHWSDCPKVIDTAITAATQTPVRGLHLLEPIHSYITPGKLTEIPPIDDKVIKIQRWWKNWLKRKRILIYLEEVKRQDEAWRRELDNVQVERQKLKEKLHLPIECLKTQDDFERAYYAIELERKKLIKSAQSLYSGQLLNFAYMYILLQEISILQKIDERKRILSEGKQMRQRNSLLNELSAPRTWISKRDGKPISMETSTEREFAQWKDIYNNLIMTDISSDKMREVLNVTYAMLEKHDSEEVNHIKDMIIQELVLLAIGVDMEKLKNFHSILENHLFDHLESYALKNRPNMQKFKISRLKCRLIVCKECNKVKPENSFDVNAGTKELIKCKSCVRLENISFKRKEYAIFRYILASLRKEEARLRCSSPIAFIMQVEDINYLINSIWHAHSALSHKSTLEDLRLCRFDNKEDWSPWNCLLLTHEEMVTHRLVTNPYSVYGECLIKIVQNKHKIAHEYFKFLRNVSERHQQTLEWINIKKTKPYKYYNVTMPKVSYFNQPKNIKLNPSQKRPGVKCSAEIQRL